MQQHLDKQPNNVLAVHCKGGKGRTGTIICAHLMYTALLETQARSASRALATQPCLRLLATG